MSITQDNLQYSKNANLVEARAFGFDALSTGQYNTQEYAVIEAYTNLTLSYTNLHDGVQGSVTIPAGSPPLFGRFTNIEVTAGTGVAYLAKTRV